MIPPWPPLFELLGWFLFLEDEWCEVTWDALEGLQRVEWCPPPPLTRLLLPWLWWLFILLSRWWADDEDDLAPPPWPPIPTPPINPLLLFTPDPLSPRELEVRVIPERLGCEGGLKTLWLELLELLGLLELFEKAWWGWFEWGLRWLSDPSPRVRGAVWGRSGGLLEG